MKVVDSYLQNWLINLDKNYNDHSIEGALSRHKLKRLAMYVCRLKGVDSYLQNWLDKNYNGHSIEGALSRHKLKRLAMFVCMLKVLDLYVQHWLFPLNHYKCHVIEGACCILKDLASELTMMKT